MTFKQLKEVAFGWNAVIKQTNKNKNFSWKSFFLKSTMRLVIESTDVAGVKIYYWTKYVLYSYFIAVSWVILLLLKFFIHNWNVVMKQEKKIWRNFFKFKKLLFTLWLKLHVFFVLKFIFWKSTFFMLLLLKWTNKKHYGKISVLMANFFKI